MYIQLNTSIIDVKAIYKYVSIKWKKIKKYTLNIKTNFKNKIT
jgi:hypothetical protein